MCLLKKCFLCQARGYGNSKKSLKCWCFVGAVIIPTAACTNLFPSAIWNMNWWGLHEHRIGVVTRVPNSLLRHQTSCSSLSICWRSTAGVHYHMLIKTSLFFCANFYSTYLSLYMETTSSSGTTRRLFYLCTASFSAAMLASFNTHSDCFGDPTHLSFCRIWKEPRPIQAFVVCLQGTSERPATSVPHLHPGNKKKRGLLVRTVCKSTRL